MSQAPRGVARTRRGPRNYPGGACDTPGGWFVPGGGLKPPRGRCETLRGWWAQNGCNGVYF
nr:MAG TPA: hypothetical protein [Caudoviricetes sp.]DAT85177.1 MAG TPA: hypothetical protein [Caudoviricetes sp.]